MKKLLSLMLALMLAVSSFAGAEAMAAQNGWTQDKETNSWYYYENGKVVTGWKSLNKKWYFFDAAGRNLRNEPYFDAKDELYWFDESGVMKTGWYKHTVSGTATVDGRNDSYQEAYWYYLGTDGKARKGWQKVGGKWYYFDPSLAVMYENCVIAIGNKRYAFNKGGAMATGWFNDRSSYVDEKGKTVKNNCWYYLNSSGAAVTGWQKVGGVWYYFNAGTAVMLTGWQKLGGVWYYFKGSGAMSTGWQKVGGKWYYFNGSGAMRTGWLKSGGVWYYFNTSGAMLANTSQKIGGKTYKFNASGACTNP